MKMSKSAIDLIVRPPVVGDAKAILDYLKIVGAETDNLTFGAEGHPNTVEQEEKFIASIGKDHNGIMLLGLVEDEIIAIGSLFGSSRERLKHSLELGISVKRAYWHMGVASKVIKQMIEIAQTFEHVIQVTLSVIVDNQRAIGLYHKLGFIDTGIHHRHIKVKDKYKDTLIMVLPLR